MRPFLLRMGLVKMLPLLATTTLPVTLPVVSPAVWADPARPEDAVVREKGAEAPVELDFLLFLAEQQQLNGEWIDPVQLLEQEEREAQHSAQPTSGGQAHAE